MPLFRQIANVLKADGYLFTVFTPAAASALMSDRSADDFIELALDTTETYPPGHRPRQPQPRPPRDESETPLGDGGRVRDSPKRTCSRS